jgi:hypothetical protein
MVSGMLAAMVRMQNPSSHGYDAELLCHVVEKLVWLEKGKVCLARYQFNYQRLDISNCPSICYLVQDIFFGVISS